MSKKPETTTTTENDEQNITVIVKTEDPPKPHPIAKTISGRRYQVFYVAKETL